MAAAKLYILFAHKPSSADSCMGCCMASYDSDVIFEQNLSREQLIQKLAELQSYERRTNEAGYQYIYFCEAAPEMSQEEFDEITSRADPVSDKLRIQSKHAKELENAKREAAAQQQQEARERKQLEELQSKYGGAN